MFNGICEKCSHRPTCKKPCERFGNICRAMAWSCLNQIGTNMEILFWLFSQTIGHVPFSQEWEGYNIDRVASISTENEIPWATNEFQSRQTSIFIDRFFFGYTFKDLAIKYDCAVGTASSHYYHAIERLEHIIEYADQFVNTVNIKKAIDEAGEKIPNGLRWLVMHKVFGIDQATISKIDGVKSSNVFNSIKDAADKLAAGELELLPFTDEERKAAAKRLAELRAQQKKYREQRKVKNLSNSKKT